MYGSFRKVLPEPERAECFGQSRSLHAGMSSCIYGKDKESDIELEVDNQYIMSPKDLKTIHLWTR